MTQGYYRNPAATRALFPEGETRGENWLDSGDRAYMAEGEVFVTGRVKDIIIKAGRNLYPHEIEELVGSVAGVRKGCVVVFGVGDAASGTERLVVVAELREKERVRDAAHRARIAQAITEELTSAMDLPPDVVELIPPQSIPKTSSGKLRRKETKKLYLAGVLGARATPTWLQLAMLALAGGAQAMRRQARRTLELLYGVYAAIVFGLWIVPTWLLVLAAPSRRLAARITSPALRLYMALVGCRIRVEGGEHVKRQRPLVFVSNHASYTDVLFLMAALGIDYRFVAKIEVHSMPLIGGLVSLLLQFDLDDLPFGRALVG